MNKVEVKFGEWIEQGLQLYKNNLGVLIVASLLAFVISGLTFGILSGPMMAGLTLIALALKDGAQPKPQGTDVTRGFQFFLPSFLLTLLVGGTLFLIYLIGAVTCVGILLFPLAAAAISAVTLFSLPLLVEQRLDVVPAVKASLAIVKGNFWMFLAFALVASLIGSVGSILCGIGVIVTLPATQCMVAVAYRDVQAQLARPATTP